MLVRRHAGTWVIFDDDYVVNEPASTYVNRLAAVRAENTVRAYAGRIAAYIGWCHDQGRLWGTSHVGTIAQYLKTLDGGAASTRSGHIVAIVGFLRWAAAHDLVDPDLPSTFVTTATYRAPGGTVHQRRVVELSAQRDTFGYQHLTEENIPLVLDGCRNWRDQTLVYLLIDTGLRIGEALGLHWSDLHLLPSTPGCTRRGPHLHVRRRVNENGATAKSRRPRVVPLTTELVRRLGSYQAEVADRVGRTTFVFVNLYRGELGAGMKYRATMSMFERLSARTGIEVRPHMCRHTAGTRWTNESGLDVAAVLLGHASISSTRIYSHHSDAQLRAAVEAAR